MKELWIILKNEEVYSIICTVLGTTLLSLTIIKEETKENKLILAFVILISGFFISMTIIKPFCNSYIKDDWKPFFYCLGGLGGFFAYKGFIGVFEKLNYEGIIRIILHHLIKNLKDVNDGMDKASDKPKGND